MDTLFKYFNYIGSLQIQYLGGNAGGLVLGGGGGGEFESI